MIGQVVKNKLRQLLNLNMVRQVVKNNIRQLVNLNMMGQVVSLYVHDTGIRLLVSRGRNVRKWGEMPLEPDLVKDGAVINETEVAAKLKRFIKDQKIPDKKVIVGISGLHCLTRPISLPELPKAMLAEAVIREAQRVLPISLEQYYLSWETVPSDNGKTQVFLAAVPCKTADSLCSMLRKAGLHPYIMDLKPLALARATNEATSMVIDVQPSEFDLVIMVDGVPQPIRTIPFPGRVLSWDDKLPAIRDELQRTIQFYNSNNPDKPLDNSVPVYISGKLLPEPDLCKFLTDELGYPASLLQSPLNEREQFDPSDYMVNIGLALHKQLPQHTSGLAVDLNVLPAAYQPEPFSWSRVLAPSSAVTVVGLLIPMVMLLQNASANIALLQEQLDKTNQLIIQKQLEKKELRQYITMLQQTLPEVEASNQMFTAALNTIDEQVSTVDGDLETVTDLLPKSMHLTDISHRLNKLTLGGLALREEEIISYATDLDTCGRFSTTVITNINRICDDNTLYTLSFTLSLTPKGTE
jgi:type IV pilus assembly protein PilM